MPPVSVADILSGTPLKSGKIYSHIYGSQQFHSQQSKNLTTPSTNRGDMQSPMQIDSCSKQPVAAFETNTFGGRAADWT